MLPILLFIGCLALSGCHTNMVKDPRPVDVVLEKIGGTWKFSSAILGGVGKQDFKNTTITFSGSESDDLIHFKIGNRPDTSPWPETGTFMLGADSNSELILGMNGDAVSYTTDGSRIEMTTPFHKPPVPDGEIILPISYSWVFKLEK